MEEVDEKGNVSLEANPPQRPTPRHPVLIFGTKSLLFVRVVSASTTSTDLALSRCVCVTNTQSTRPLIPPEMIPSCLPALPLGNRFETTTFHQRCGYSLQR